MVKRTAVILCLLLLLGATAFAGDSPVEVTSISLSPTSFKAGDTVTVTVKIKNTATNPYACVGGVFFRVEVHVFKAEPYTVANRVWTATQPLTTPLAAGEIRTVTLASKWTVPNIDTPTFHFQAWGPLCGSDEFGGLAVLKVNKVCVYQYKPHLEFAPKQAKELAPVQVPK